MDALPGPIDEANVHVAEIVLCELPREALEASHRLDLCRTDRRHQPVQCALATHISLEPRPTQQLQGHHLRLLGQLSGQEDPERLGLGRSAYPASAPLRRRVGHRYDRFPLNPPDASLAYPGQLGGLCLAVSCPSENLDLVSLQHAQHSFPRLAFARPLGPPERPSGSPRTGQNFRNGTGQNFRNPQ